MDNNLRSADAELQQRAVEYLALSRVASTDVLATVLEEMPPFPERESSILAILKKKKPGAAAETDGAPAAGAAAAGGHRVAKAAAAAAAAGGGAAAAAPVANNDLLMNNSSGANDLLGLGTSGPSAAAPAASSSLLVDVFGDASSKTTSNGHAGGVIVSNDDGLKKLVCKSNGVLFENDVIQVGVKSEYRKNLGRLSLFYGNKTSAQLLAFIPTITTPGLESSKCYCPCFLCYILKLQALISNLFRNQSSSEVRGRCGGRGRSNSTNTEH